MSNVNGWLNAFEFPQRLLLFKFSLLQAFSNNLLLFKLSPTSVLKPGLVDVQSYLNAFVPKSFVLQLGLVEDDDFKALVLQKFVFKPFENASLYLFVSKLSPRSKEKGLLLVPFGLSQLELNFVSNLGL